MCTQALLTGAGVGSISASALAAAVQWVVRDGVGMISSVFFAVRFSSYFGDFVKEWRLFADVINDVGLTLDMLSSVVPSYLYLPTLCASAACKAACGVSAGSTKVCITNYFCLSNNVADVATKENTQETAVTLVGLVFGMLFSSVFGNNSTFAWLSFIVLTALHVYCNYRAVSCLKLNSINRSRCWFLTRQFLCSKNPDGYADMSLTTINALEGVVNSVRVVYNGPRLGIKLHDALESISSTATVTPEMRWNTLRHVFADDMYCILPMRGGAFAVPIRVGATKMDELKAFFHASMLQITSSSYVDTRMAPTVVFATEAEIKQSKEKLKKKWEEFVETLRLQGWDLSDDGIMLSCSEWCFDDRIPSS